MKILFSRWQSACAPFSLVPLRVGTGVKFSLRAELELTEEEEKLAKHYRFIDAVLVAGNLFEDLKRALIPSVVLSVFVFLSAWPFFVFPEAVVGGLITFVFMFFVYYGTHRRKIIFRDLLNGGRTFHCFSIVELIQKEQELTELSSYVRQVLESAKNWDSKEAMEIPVLDPTLARQLLARAT